MRAWLLPVGLGMLAMAATAFLGPRLIDTGPAPPRAWETAAEAGYVLPFEPGPPGGTFLVVAPLGEEVALQGLRRDGYTGNASWPVPTSPLGLLLVPGQPACPCVPAQGPVALNATIYVFRTEGTLLASNNATAPLRFRPDSHFVALPYETWRLGGPMGEAMGFPPDWQPTLARVRPHLAGLSEASVATFVIEDHPQRALVGPLHVTLRVDAVPQAAAAPA